jgi:hypothetical protein
MAFLPIDRRFAAGFCCFSLKYLVDAAESQSGRAPSSRSAKAASRRLPIAVRLSYWVKSNKAA